MPSDSRKHRRRSIRRKGYDYARPGAYSVTICTQGGEFLFGQVVSGCMRMHPAGEMVWRWWQRLNDQYPSVRTDAAVVMPNHFHGIIVITGDPGSGQPPGAAPTGVGAGGSVGATQGGRPHDVAQDGIDADGTLGQPPGAAPTGVGAGGSVGATQGGRPEVAAPTNADTRDRAPPLGQIVGWFKTMTTNEYIRGVKQLGWPPFPGKVWQRNYYEHIIRNRDALGRIRVYIQTNPQRWALDRENPHCDGLDELESWIYGPS